MPSVSVIVPIYNGVDFLPAFFASLGAALPEGAQLILIDDGSEEPVWDTVPEFGRADSVMRIQNETNLGYCASVNQAFAAATGEIVVQLNTDLILESECIGAMIDLISRKRQVGIVGSKLIFPTTGLIQHAGMAFGIHTKLHTFWEMPASHPLCSKTREVQMVTGATATMTRRTLDLIGPFDETYYNHNEDIDHCLQAVRHGLRNFVCADSVAYHWRHASGPARFAGVTPAEAVFWTRWGKSFETDLGDFVDEAVDYAMSQSPELGDAPCEIVDLSRGPDQPIVLESLRRYWPDLDERFRAFRQTGNAAKRLHLPLLLPHWMIEEPRPFVYVVDSYRELEENQLWFARRRNVVEDELIVDLRAAALRASELSPR